MGINNSLASISGSSSSGGKYRIRDEFISARNQRRLDKKKSKIKKNYLKWEGEVIFFNGELEK